MLSKGWNPLKPKVKGLPDGWKRGLMTKFGLEPGVVLVAYGGKRYRFGRIGGLSADRVMPWCWGYLIRSSGRVCKTATRVERWVKE